jgi:hypothetical protein
VQARSRNERAIANPKSAAAFSLSGAISFERVRQENAGTQNAKKCHYGLNHRNHLAEYSRMRRQAQPHSQTKLPHKQNSSHEVMHFGHGERATCWRAA